MGVSGRIVKVTQKSTILWSNGRYISLPFISKHAPGDIIDDKDRLLVPCRSTYDHARQQRHYRLVKRKMRHIRTIRNYLDEEGFIEVITKKLASERLKEPNIQPIITEAGILAPSPEVRIKELIVMGFDKLYELGFAYRNDQEDRWHAKEFLMLEYYETYRDPKHLIERLLEMIRILNGSDLLNYRGTMVRLNNIRYVSYKEIFKDTLGIDTDAPAVEKLKEQYMIDGDIDRYELLDAIFATKIQDKLGIDIPTVIWGFPAERASLAKVENGVAMRFELYIAGIEIANCYEEETDPEAIGRRLHGSDKRFLQAMNMGLPPSSGIAVGIDRLIMLLEDLSSIHELYP